MAKMPIMDRSISGVTKGREAMLNLKHLDYFYEVARCGSITKAAQNLYMTQPALSKAIHQLEDDLNCKLLNRTIKGVSLTSQGEILLDAVITSMRLLERAREKIAELNDEMSSCVRLGAGGDTVNCILLSLLNTFAHENANVTVQIKEYSTSRGIKALLNNDVDIVFIHSYVEGGDVECRQICALKQILVVGERFSYLSMNKGLSLLDLSNQPFITYTEDSAKRNMMCSFFEKQKFAFQITYEVDNTETIIRLVEMGKGIAILPEFYVKEFLKERRLFQIQIQEEIPDSCVWMACRTKDDSSDASNQLKEYILNSTYNKFSHP